MWIDRQLLHPLFFLKKNNASQGRYLANLPIGASHLSKPMDMHACDALLLQDSWSETQSQQVFFFSFLASLALSWRKIRINKAALLFPPFGLGSLFVFFCRQNCSSRASFASLVPALLLEDSNLQNISTTFALLARTYLGPAQLFC